LIVANRVGAQVRAKVEGEIQKIVGARIYLGTSLKEHLLMMARSWVSRSVGNIVLRMAATHFVVEMFAVRLLEWVGPRLREFLRPKGNLESRTDRAIEGLRDRRGDLDRMDSSEEMIDVRRNVEAATNHIKANNFLRGDIQRARRDDLFKRLAAEETELLRAIDRARTRFLMDSLLAQELFGELASELRGGRAKTAEILEKLTVEPGASAGLYDTVALPEWKQRFPGKFGLEINSTGNGYRVRVTDPSGRVLANNLFKPEEATADLFVCRDAVWSDGTPMRVSLYVTLRDAAGLPKSGWMMWWTQERLVGRLGIEYFKRGNALLYDARYNIGSKGTQSDSTGRYAMEISQAGRAVRERVGFQGSQVVYPYPIRVRVIDPKGKVILNLILMPAPVREAGTSNTYLEYVGGPAAWTDGTPVRRVVLGIVSGRANPHDSKDIVPNTGSLRWFGDDSRSRSSILFSLDFMPRR
jgi:hypothetical protein